MLPPAGAAAQASETVLSGFLLLCSTTSGVEHSHWSRSVQILCSDWLVCHKNIIQGTQSPLSSMSFSNIIEFRTSSAPLCWAFPALFCVFMASATSQTSSGPVWSQSVQELNHLCVTLLYIGGCFRPPSWTAGFALFFRRRAGTFLWKHATVLLHDQNCHCLAVFILTGCTKQN